MEKAVKCAHGIYGAESCAYCAWEFALCDGEIITSRTPKEIEARSPRDPFSLRLPRKGKVDYPVLQQPDGRRDGEWIRKHMRIRERWPPPRCLKELRSAGAQQVLQLLQPRLVAYLKWRELWKSPGTAYLERLCGFRAVRSAWFEGIDATTEVCLADSAAAIRRGLWVRVVAGEATPEELAVDQQSWLDRKDWSSEAGGWDSNRKIAKIRHKQRKDFNTFLVKHSLSHARWCPECYCDDRAKYLGIAIADDSLLRSFWLTIPGLKAPSPRGWPDIQGWFFIDRPEGDPWDYRLKPGRPQGVWSGVLEDAPRGFLNRPFPPGVPRERVLCPLGTIKGKGGFPKHWGESNEPGMSERVRRARECALCLFHFYTADLNGSHGTHAGDVRETRGSEIWEEETQACHRYAERIVVRVGRHGEDGAYIERAPKVKSWINRCDHGWFQDKTDDRYCSLCADDHPEKKEKVADTWEPDDGPWPRKNLPLTEKEARACLAKDRESGEIDAYTDFYGTTQWRNHDLSRAQNLFRCADGLVNWKSARKMPIKDPPETRVKQYAEPLRGEWESWLNQQGYGWYKLCREHEIEKDGPPISAVAGAGEPKAAKVGEAESEHDDWLGPTAESSTCYGHRVKNRDMAQMRAKIDSDELAGFQERADARRERPKGRPDWIYDDDFLRFLKGRFRQKFGDVNAERSMWALYWYYRLGWRARDIADEWGVETRVVKGLIDRRRIVGDNIFSGLASRPSTHETTIEGTSIEGDDYGE